MIARREFITLLGGVALIATACYTLYYKLKFQKNPSFARRFLRATWPLASDHGRHLSQS
jgi:hypothetical protein